MKSPELLKLAPGDRVQLLTPGGTARGVVEYKQNGIIHILWDDNGGKWTINPRARFDRERALNLSREVPA